jgi:putative transferase (TIGR04331 family)
MINRKKKLVTTALAETWPRGKDENVLFLGDWCLLYSNKKQWSKMDYELVSYHWDDRNKLYADYQYLNNYYERLIIGLKLQLNQQHGVDFSSRYWRILIGPWIAYFIQMFFDRWCSVQNAIKLSVTLETKIVKYSFEEMVPLGFGDFPKYFVSDEWNHFLYSTILAEYSAVDCEEVVPNSSFPLNHQVARISFKEKLKRKIKTANYYSTKAISKIFGEADIVLINSFLPITTQAKIYLENSSVVGLGYDIEWSPKKYNSSFRNWEVELETESEFEKLTNKILPKHIPLCFIENYNTIKKTAETKIYPKNPKLIFTLNPSYGDVSREYIAQKTEIGAKLLAGQHGGHYGIAKWSFLEDHEIAISDKYLTYGWTQKNNPKTVPFGMRIRLKKKKLAKKRFEIKENILLVTTIVPRYSYWLQSFPVAGQWLDYIKQHYIFVDSLSRDLKPKVLARIYHKADYGWDQIARWNDYSKELKIDGGKIEIEKLIRKTKIHVSSYNATTYLETFQLNIPTVIFWDPGYWELRSEAKPYFEKLSEVRIFHSTPESAAKHINEVWGDIESWWYSEKLQSVLKNFCQQYCNSVHEYSNKLANVIKELKMEESKNSV